MSDSWLDHIPSHERLKIRTRLRSPEAYAALREKVKGPEDLEKEMKKSEVLAELSFTMETEKDVKQALKSQIEKDCREQGMESVLEGVTDIAPDVRQAIEQGKFQPAVSSHPSTGEDALVIVAEGTVQETLPVKTRLSDTYVSQFVSSLT